MNTNLIGISGKLNSGKDTVALIIQLLCEYPKLSDELIADLMRDTNPSSYTTFKVKKFAGKLKRVASLLTGIPVHMFEDQEFKKEFLPAEWNYWAVSVVDNGKLEYIKGCFETKEEAEQLAETLSKAMGTFRMEYIVGEHRMTVRELLQKLGTDAMRVGLHQNVWVNATFADFKPVKLSQYDPSKWIITDVRFPNEAAAIIDRGGVLLRLERIQNTGDHPSETALDQYPFEHIIYNTGSMEQLVGKVRTFLTEHTEIFRKEKVTHGQQEENQKESGERL